MIMKVPYLGYSLIPAKLRQLVTLSSILQCQHTFTIFRISKIYRSFAGAAIKNLPANAGDVRDAGLIPGSGRSPGEGHDNPLQYSCLESPMDRGTWRATVLGVAKSRTQLSDQHFHFFFHFSQSRRGCFSSLQHTGNIICSLSFNAPTTHFIFWGSYFTRKRSSP